MQVALQLIHEVPTLSKIHAICIMYYALFIMEAIGYMCNKFEINPLCLYWK